MITLITYGAGMLVGSWLSGYVVDLYTHTAANGAITHAWRSIWLVSAACSAIVLVLFFFTFHDSDRMTATAHEAEAEPASIV
jgi:MFS family permease